MIQNIYIYSYIMKLYMYIIQYRKMKIVKPYCSGPPSFSPLPAVKFAFAFSPLHPFELSPRLLRHILLAFPTCKILILILLFRPFLSILSPTSSSSGVGISSLNFLLIQSLPPIRQAGTYYLVAGMECVGSKG